MTRFLVLAALAASSVGVGCNGSTPPPASVEAATPLVPRICTSPKAGVFGVKPLGNKTKQPTPTDGTDEVLIAAMTDSGCFTIAERDRLQILIEEIGRCDPENADAKFFDCKSFAKKGHLYGITHFVFGDVTMMESDVKGTELSLKLPGIGGIEAGRSYGALGLSLRVIEVETGKVVATAVVNAVVPSDKGGLSLPAGGGFDLKAAAHERTPLGRAIQDMLAEATKRLAAAI